MAKKTLTIDDEVKKTSQPKQTTQPKNTQPKTTQPAYDIKKTEDLFKNFNDTYAKVQEERSRPIDSYVKAYEDSLGSTKATVSDKKADQKVVDRAKEINRDTWNFNMKELQNKVQDTKDKYINWLNEGSEKITDSKIERTIETQDNPMVDFLKLYDDKQNIQREIYNDKSLYSAYIEAQRNIGNMDDEQKAYYNQAIEQAELNDDRREWSRLVKEAQSYDYGAEGDDLLGAVKRTTQIGANVINSTVANVAGTYDVVKDYFNATYRNHMDDLLASGAISQEEYDRLQAEDFDINSEDNFLRTLKDYTTQAQFNATNGLDAGTKFLVDASSSAAQCFLGALTFGSNGYLAIMGTSSLTDKYYQNVAEGYNETQSMNNAFLTGLMSVLTERAGVERVTNFMVGMGADFVLGNVLGNFALGFYKSGVPEAAEEAVEYIGDALIDMITLGKPLDEVWTWEEFFMNAALGFSSGGMSGGFAGGYYGIQTMDQAKRYRSNINTVQTALDNGEIEGTGQQQIARAYIAGGNMALNNFNKGSVIANGIQLSTEDGTQLTYRQQVDMLRQATVPVAENMVGYSENVLNAIQSLNNDINTQLAQKGMVFKNGTESYLALSTEAKNNVKSISEVVDRIRQNANPNLTVVFNPDVLDAVNGEAIGSDIIVLNPNSKESFDIISMHEFTHLAEGTPEYEEYTKFLEKNFNEIAKLTDGKFGGYTGNTLKELEDNIKDVYANNGATLSDKGARKEAMAYITQASVRSNRVINRLTESDPSLAYKMFDLVRTTFSGGSLQTEIEKRFINAFKARTPVYDGAMQFNLRSLKEGGFEVIKDTLDTAVNDKNNPLDADKAADMLASFEAIIKDAQAVSDSEIDPSFTEWSNKEYTPGDTWIIGDAEYKYNSDGALVCKKRIGQDRVLNRLAREGYLTNKELTPLDMYNIKTVIRIHGGEISCAICYVDTGREIQGEWATTLEENYNALVYSLIPENLRGQININEFNYGNKQIDNATENLLKDMPDDQLDFTFINETIEKGYNSNTKRYNQLAQIAQKIKTDPNMRQLLNKADLISSEGQDAIRHNNLDLYNIMHTFQGQNKPKDSVAPMVYDNDIVKFMEEKAIVKFDKNGARVIDNKKLEKLLDELYHMGGWRSQSFSDYIGSMVIDYVSDYMEKAMFGAPQQTYTKEEAHARLFGMTGGKENMSIVLKGADVDDAEWTRIKSLGFEKFIQEQRKREGKPGAFSQEQWNAIDEKGYAAMEVPGFLNPIQAKNWAETHKEQAALDPKYQEYQKHAGLDKDGVMIPMVYDVEVTDNDGNTSTKKVRETFPADAAYELQNHPEYSKNCGTVAIGTSDAMIWSILNRQAKIRLEDGRIVPIRIKQLIPYHSSGQNHLLASLRNIDCYNDYQAFQNTKDQNGKTIPHNKDFDFYEALFRAEDNALAHLVKVGDTYQYTNENGERRYTDEEIANMSHDEKRIAFEAFPLNEDNEFFPGFIAARDYLYWCEDNGYTAKFSKFARRDQTVSYRENANLVHDYYLTLADFSLTDVNNNYAKQGAVRMAFPDNFQEIMKSSIEAHNYDETHYTNTEETIHNEIIKTLGLTKVDTSLNPVEIIPISETSREVKATDQNAVRYEQFEPLHLSIDPTVETEYDTAVANNDRETASRIVKEVAMSKGYTVEAYHGTNKFGFTKIDTSKSDDGISFFVTNDVDTASTYGAFNGVREISEDVDGSDLRADAERLISDTATDAATVLSRYAGIQGWADVDSINRMVLDIANEYYDEPDDVDDKIYEGFEESYIYPLYDMYVESEEAQGNDEPLEPDEWEDEFEDDLKEIYRARESLIGAAQSYASVLRNLEYGDTPFSRLNPGAYHFYVNPDGLLEFDGEGRHWNKLQGDGRVLPKTNNGKPWTTRTVSEWAKENEYAGVLFKNIIDDGGRGRRVTAPGDVYALFYPQEQVKSADPFTYDDNGNIIPLSERFNPENEKYDIRYSIDPEAEPLTVDDATINSLLSGNNKDMAAIDRQKQTLIDTAPKWIPNYELIHKNYPYVSESNLSNSLFDILAYGELSDQTRESLKRDFVFGADYEGVDPDLKELLIDGALQMGSTPEEAQRTADIIDGFVNEAVEFFATDQTYRADKSRLNRIANKANMFAKAEGVRATAPYDVYADIAAKGIDKLTESEKRIGDIKANELLENSELIDAMINNGVDYANDLNTINQIIHNVANGNRELEQMLNNSIGLKRDIAIQVEEDLNDQGQEEINKVLELGIKPDSKEDKAITWLIEGHTKDTITTKDGKLAFQPFTEADLKEQFDYKMKNGKMAWENIQDAAKIITDFYDDRYNQVNDGRDNIYLDDEITRKYDKAKIEAEIKVQKELVSNLENQLRQNPTAELQAALNRAQTELETWKRRLSAKIDQEVNGDDVRRRHLLYRKNYTHHSPVKTNFAQRLYQALTDNGFNVPTALSGISQYVQPNSVFSTILLEQNTQPGMNYNDSALANLRDYTEKSSYMIAFDPVVASYRNFIHNMESLDTDNKLSNFHKYMVEYTNQISGKSNKYDRFFRDAMSGNAAQRAWNVFQVLNSQSKAAAVLGNVRSAVVQIANLPNGLAVVKMNGGTNADIAKGINTWMQSYREDSPINQSGFMRNRFNGLDIGESKLTLNNAANAMMQFGDELVARQLWCIGYEMGVRQGVENPVYFADNIVRDSIGGRHTADYAPMMRSRVINSIAPFQLETNNVWQTMKRTVKDKEWQALLYMVIANEIVGSLFKELFGDKVLFTPIRDLVEGWMDAEDLDKSGQVDINERLTTAVGHTVGDLISSIPFSAYIAELVGIAADPYGKWDKIFGDNSPNRYGISTLGISAPFKFIQDPTAQGALEMVANYIPGGNQLMKTGKSAYYYSKGVYTTKKGKIGFAVDDDPINTLKAMLFGIWSTDAGQQYLEGGNVLSDKQTNVFDYLASNDIKGQDAYAIADEITSSDKRTEIIDTLNNADYLTDEQRNEIYDMYTDTKTNDRLNDFAEAYGLTFEQEYTIKTAQSIEKDENQSAAEKRLEVYEEQGIMDELIQYVQENDLKYGDVGLNKTVVQDYLSSYEEVMDSQSNKNKKRRTTRKSSKKSVKNPVDEFRASLLKDQADSLNNILSEEVWNKTEKQIQANIKKIREKYMKNGLYDLIKRYLKNHPEADPKQFGL